MVCLKDSELLWFLMTEVGLNSAFGQEETNGDFNQGSHNSTFILNSDSTGCSRKKMRKPTSRLRLEFGFKIIRTCIGGGGGGVVVVVMMNFLVWEFSGKISWIILSFPFI